MDKKTPHQSNFISSHKVIFRPYWCLVVLRFLLTLIPQTGYIHPDEFFQSTEFLSGDIFGFASRRTWEFDASFPIRSIAVPYLFFGPSFYFMKLASSTVYSWFGIQLISPYFQLVIPRLTLCFLSLMTDFFMYRICCKYGQEYRSRLLLMSSSFVTLVYATRTFSNTIELFMFSLLVHAVTDAMAKTDKSVVKAEYYRKCIENATWLRERVRLERIRRSLSMHSLAHVMRIATIVVIGTFNRPTFLAFAAAPIFFWLLRGLGSRSVTFGDFHARTAILIIATIPSLFVCIVADSLYYGRVTVPELFARTFSLESFVVTPYNFIIYNSQKGNLAVHGLHPRYMHLFVNIPLLFNALGIIGILSFLSIIYGLACRERSVLPRIQSLNAMMMFCWTVPVAALSAVPHQEARFLLPCLFPLVFLHADRLKPARLLSTWFIANFLCTMYFGFLQQAGVFPLLRQLQTEIEAKPRLTAVHIVTTHTYMLPQAFLQARFGPSAHFISPTGTRYTKSQDVFIHEMGSSGGVTAAADKVAMIRNDCSTLAAARLRCRIYLVVPTSRLSETRHQFGIRNVSCEVEQIFYPHVTMEALPQFNWTELTRNDECGEGPGGQKLCLATTSPSSSSLWFLFTAAGSFFSQLGLAVLHFPKT